VSRHSTSSTPPCAAYDLAKFGSGIVIDILRPHPMVIIADILHENPCFVPPDEFLRELRGRSRALPAV